MRFFKKYCTPVFVALACVSLFAQTHVSVPLDNHVYYVLEQAELRGLCAPLPSVKPYAQKIVIDAIYEILESDTKFRFAGITKGERDILLETLDLLEPKKGFDIHRGEYFYEDETQSGHRVTFNAGIGWDSVVGVSKIKDGDMEFGTDDWFTAFLKGDIGKNFSWAFSGSGGIISAPVKKLGTYYPYYEGATISALTPDRLYGGDRMSLNNPFEVYSEPIPYFPYTYRKRWDASVFRSENLSSSGFYNWPQGFSFGYSIMGEASVSLLDGLAFVRGGRFLREWGAETRGSSLVFSEAARPFIGVEATFSPFSWISFSAITGVLEFYAVKDVIKDAANFQNAFSMALVDVGYKNYVRFKFGTTGVWPKRFELGYPFPLNSNFFYQNNIGDFDNMALYASLSGGLPGVGKAWVSFFADEFDLSSPDFFHQDRNMYAYQAGISVAIPVKFLPFTNLMAQYTKIEPYTYTHLRLQTPWYGNLWLEEAYVNNGVSLGYYLPPNSDEVKVRFESMIEKDLGFHIQYQLIRHGADFGDRSVDGSSLSSELAPDDRNKDAPLWKYFLHDGAYEWQHIVKIGGERTLSKMLLPVQFFAEGGLVMSFFTDIDGKPNSGKSFSYSKIDTNTYPATTRLLATVGFKIWPR